MMWLLQNLFMVLSDLFLRFSYCTIFPHFFTQVITIACKEYQISYEPNGNSCYALDIITKVSSLEIIRIKLRLANDNEINISRIKG